MNWSNEQLWERFKKYYREYPSLGLALDISRMSFSDDFLPGMEPHFEKAFHDMADLERGAIANPDEKRMVGHYWLRNPGLAPTVALREEIENNVAAIKRFAARIHSDQIKGARSPFKNILIIGIGGSALGPQFVSNALSEPDTDKMVAYFFDNTDPDGMHRTLRKLHGLLSATLCIVISKSGGTKETRNGMLEAKAAYERAGLRFEDHAIAVTGVGSELDKAAIAGRWLERFPMWDWVGGRTSELSAVGLLPAALQGFNISDILAGASACDEVTRNWNLQQNPSALLASMWFDSGNGKGTKDMVVLPYKDRLELFSRYLQQLVMESLGKELDCAGNLVNQGIAVYGNKGSTDQHAYVQQLRDGIHNFFVTFIEVAKDCPVQPIEVEPDITSGDYLNGFLLGTRRALLEKGRQSISITLADVSPFRIGALIALFERAVGFYASLINVNAYHQPGVESGKRAAEDVLKLQVKALSFLKGQMGKGFNVEELAALIGHPEEAETLFKICRHLAANPERRMEMLSEKNPAHVKFRMV